MRTIFQGKKREKISKFLDKSWKEFNDGSSNRLENIKKAGCELYF